MAYRIVHRAGPYVVRVKAGRPPLRVLGTFYWIEGPGLPTVAPTTPDEAWRRHPVPIRGGARHVAELADLLAIAYRAGRETV